MQRHPLDVERRQQLGGEMETGRRRGRRARLVGVDGLVAAGIGERLVDVRRQRRLAERLALEPDLPAAVRSGATSSTAEPFDPGSREPLAGAQRRDGRASASQTRAVERLEQEDLRGPAGRSAEAESRRDAPSCRSRRRARRAELAGQVGEDAMADLARLARGRRAAATRRGARPGAARSARAAARSRARPISSDGQSSLAAHGRTRAGTGETAHRRGARRPHLEQDRRGARACPRRDRGARQP